MMAIRILVAGKSMWSCERFVGPQSWIKYTKTEELDPPRLVAGVHHFVSPATPVTNNFLLGAWCFPGGHFCVHLSW